MAKQLEFYFDYGSPTTYLAWTQLPGIAERTGAEIVWRPMLLGGVFKATGNRTPVEVEAKGRWMLGDIERFAARYEVPYEMNPHFIVNTLTVMRGAVHALAQGVLPAYNRAMFGAMWVDGRDLAEPAEIAAVLNEAGLDAEGFAAAVQTPEVKRELIERTEEAVARGVFGAPSMFVDGELHFGQDRLDWVEAALAG